MQSAIDTRITLSGLEEVRAKLTEVGASGEGAFSKIGESAKTGSEGTSQFSGALGALGEKMGLPIGEAEKLGDVLKNLSFTEGIGGLAALGTAIVAAGVAFMALGEHAAIATREIANHAATLGLTTEAFEGLTFAAASVGVSTESANKAFDRFSAKIGAAREKQEAFASATDRAAGAVNKQDAALKNAAEAVAKAFTAKDTAQGIETVYPGLPSVMQYDKTTTALHLAQAAYYKEASRVRDAFAAEGRAAAEGPIKSLIDQVAEAGKGNNFESLAMFADKFNAITDATKRAAAGREAFGKGWAEIAPMLVLGSEGLRKYAEEWKALEITATKAEEKMAAGYAAAANKLKLVTEGLSNAVGNIIGQLFTPGMEALANTLASGQENIRAFAEGFVEHLRPAFQYVAEYARAFVQALQDITAGINKVFGTNFSTVMVIATGLLVAFARPLLAIAAAFVLVEAAIKTVFGPNFDIAKIAGYSAALTGLVYVVRSLGAALMALWFNPFGLILAGVLALGAAILVINGDVSSISDSIKKYIGEDAAHSFDGFVETVRKGWEGVKSFMVKTFTEWVIAFNDWLANSESAAAGILRLILRIAKALGDASHGAISLGSEGGSESNPGGGNASGGSLARAGGGRVPGSGFGDSVRALLTPGEFVHRVAAVRHYGLDFMHRLNNLQIPRFDLGGLVGSLRSSFAPAGHFAGGGPVEAIAGSSRSHFTISLNGENFEASSDSRTAGRLIRHAGAERLKRAGTLPGWVT